MPDKFKNIIKSFTEKGSALRPDKDQKKKNRVAKEKHKTFSTYGGYGEVTKGKDASGNKVKESYKTYKNPLNQEQVTVKKRKENGRVVSKEVTRDKYEGMGPMRETMREPMKEAVARAAGEVGPMAADRIKGMIGTPAAAPSEPRRVPYIKSETVSDAEKADALVNKIKQSQSETQQALDKANEEKEKTDQAFDKAKKARGKLFRAEKSSKTELKRKNPQTGEWETVRN